MDDEETIEGMQSEGVQSRESVPSRVHELEGQVTAFTGLGEAIKVVDDVLGRASEELARGDGNRSPRAMVVARREVRAVVLA